VKIRLQKAHLMKSALRGHSEGTQRALRGPSDRNKKPLRSTQRALRGIHEGRSVEGAERHRCSVFASSARCASSFRVYNLDAILSFLSRSLSISSASR